MEIKIALLLIWSVFAAGVVAYYFFYVRPGLKEINTALKRAIKEAEEFKAEIGRDTKKALEKPRELRALTLNKNQESEV